MPVFYKQKWTVMAKKMAVLAVCIAFVSSARAWQQGN